MLNLALIEQAPGSLMCFNWKKLLSTNGEVIYIYNYCVGKATYILALHEVIHR